jgi:hypothetical protein
MTEFAKMFGFPNLLGFKATNDNKPSNDNSWGHLTCGGTVANC